MPKINQLARVAGSLKKGGHVNWYPGHMYSGLKQMIGKLNTVDCVIEVHDARIPFSGRNKEFRHHLGTVKPHLLVLNKRDLADLSQWDAIKAKLYEQGDKDVLLTDLTGNIGSLNTCGYTKMMSRVVDLINKSDRYNRTLAIDFKVMICGIPNVGKSTLINRLRQHHLGLKGSPAAVSSRAGFTKIVENRIKISSRPPIYLLDTPGVLEPSDMKNTTTAMQLAICSTINDDILNPIEVTAFLLETLNKRELTSYVAILGLDKPQDNVIELYKQAISMDALSKAINPIEEHFLERIDSFCWQFVKRFRRGMYGPIMFHDSDQT